MNIHILKVTSVIIIICGLFIYYKSCVQPDILTYNVQVDRNNPYQAKISVDTSSLKEIKLLQPRTINQNEKTKFMIACDKQRATPLNEELIVRCDQISWNIDFKAPLINGEDASQQNNLFIDQPEPLWLLQEGISLPRIINQNEMQVCINDGRVSRCKPFPTAQQPPLIMGFSHQNTEYEFENFKIIMFGDIEPKHAQNLLQKYNIIVSYLISVFPHDNRKKVWDLICLPIERSSGAVGGAAGYNGFVANYPVESGVFTKQSEEWLLRISAHEIIHVVTSLNNPIWIEESLAEYYAFKITEKLGVVNINPYYILDKHGSKIPHANRGLYYAEKQFKESKDMSFYPLFYIKGAAFWHAIDLALQDKEGSLDDYIRELEGLNYDDGKLPEKFEIMLRQAVTAPVWDKIKEVYLLDSSSVTQNK